MLRRLRRRLEGVGALLLVLNAAERRGDIVRDQWCDEICGKERVLSSTQKHTRIQIKPLDYQFKPNSYYEQQIQDRLQAYSAKQTHNTRQQFIVSNQTRRANKHTNQKKNKLTTIIPDVEKKNRDS